MVILNNTMKRILANICKVAFVFSNIIYLYGLLVAIGGAEAYLLSEDDDKAFYFLGLFIGFIGLLLIGIFFYFFKGRPTLSFILTEYKKVIVSYLIAFILSILAPFYILNFNSYSNVISRADYRYEDGKWHKAMRIYLLLSWRLDTPKLEILEMQKILNKAGYYDYTIDGKPHLNIIAQLQNFQKENNINSDGYFGKETRTLIYGIIFKDKLNIKSLKPTLEQVNDAVKHFQKINEIYIDGYIGDETLNLLRNLK